MCFHTDKHLGIFKLIEKCQYSALKNMFKCQHTYDNKSNTFVADNENNNYDEDDESFFEEINIDNDGISINYEDSWIHSNMDFYHIEDGDTTVEILNTGALDKDFYKYSLNFQNAADKVIHYLIQDSDRISELDLWYFAIIYLYRQSLELILKACIFQIVTDLESRKSIISSIRHDLSQAFDKLLELKSFAMNENAEWLKAFLSDIARIDKDSDMFRFPFSNKMKVLFNEQTHIDLCATKINMNRAFETIKSIFISGEFPVNVFNDFEPKLIIEGGNYYTQSVVGYKFSKGSFYPFVESYIKVADFIKNYSLNNHDFELFLPMCYLYRNAIELGLKRIIFESSHIDYAKATRIMHKKKHSVLGLWNSIREEVIEYANAPDDDDTINNADKCIKKLHDIDTGSSLFRYPCNMNLEVYFKHRVFLSIENVSNYFEAIFNFFNAVNTMLSVAKEYEYDMLSEMGDYYGL